MTDTTKIWLLTFTLSFMVIMSLTENRRSYNTYETCKQMIADEMYVDYSGYKKCFNAGIILPDELYDGEFK